MTRSKNKSARLGGLLALALGAWRCWRCPASPPPRTATTTASRIAGRSATTSR